MEQQPGRPSASDLQQAIDSAGRPGPRTRGSAPEGRPGARPRLGPVAFSVALVILLAVGWTAAADLRDPFPTEPETTALGATSMLDVARLAVEEYWRERGTLPPDLGAVGMDALPVTYTRYLDSFDLAADDGWGGQIIYHGAREATP